MKVESVLIYLLGLQVVLSRMRHSPVLSFIMYRKPPCKDEGDICIDIYKCPYFVMLMNVVQKTNPHFVITEMRAHQCGFIDDRPKMCCTPIKNETEKEETLSVDNENQDVLPFNSCGNVRMHSRIIYGEKPILGEFPWMAMLFYTTSKGPEFLCGGSLISEKYVLTAAHCINGNILGVRVGEYNIYTNKDCEPHSSVCAPPYQDFYIDTIIIHPRYNRRSQAHDIAIIRMSQPANLTDYVSPICLPFSNTTYPEAGIMTVAGWGMTEKGYRSPILKKADIPLVPLETCRRIFHNYAVLLDSHMCAGGERKDSCNGDSGGPLFWISVEDGRAKYVQAGIVSFGAKNCGSFGLPGIYTKVQPYVNWIIDQVEP
ncbi:phenoloxidase-activating factor 1-like [Harmonia axyridis]|uniref:phenoloxidase-activating factor 1-like n=1 Tax=Harmonia axyridis TaxID=115357 RepID=UPI001E274F94|nr:phenoloxidase-activating factor 1-like [Harmonia axyridis]